MFFLQLYNSFLSTHRMGFINKDQESGGTTFYKRDINVSVLYPRFQDSLQQWPLSGGLHCSNQVLPYHVMFIDSYTVYKASAFCLAIQRAQSYIVPLEVAFGGLVMQPPPKTLYFHSALKPQ